MATPEDAQRKPRGAAAAASPSASAATAQEQSRLAKRDRLLRQRGFVGSKEERLANREAVKAARREVMDPQQRGKLEAEEGHRSERKRVAEENKILRTRGFVGTKAERQQMRERKAAIQRERMLANLPEDKRKAFLKQEAAGKRAQAAKQQKSERDKLLRKKGFVGSKEERLANREAVKAARRDKALEGMTEDQRKTFLAKEEKAAQSKAAEEQKKKDDKTRRTVAKVGSKEEREAHRKEKARLEREDKLAKMTPEEKEKFLADEAAAEGQRKAEEKRRAEAEQAQEDAKAARQVGKVGSKEERAKWREARGRHAEREAAKDAPPTLVQESQPPGQLPSPPPVVALGNEQMNATATAQAWEECAQRTQQMTA